MPNRINNSFFLMLILFSVAIATRAQGTFNSGSTGADGAFSPTANIAVTLPPDGVLNYTTINIPLGVTVTFVRNAKNTPVTMLASGNVTIAGNISFGGSAGTTYFGGKGGPGGFDGGDGGMFIGDKNGKPGGGPGGGGGGKSPTGVEFGKGAPASHFSRANYLNAIGGIIAAGPNDGAIADPYNRYTLLPLLGGSGGGGGTGSTLYGSGGGGGGGALLLASSGTITFASSANFYGNGGLVCNCGNAPGGSGSGGSLRLVANTISGSPYIDLRGFGGASLGYFRPETFNRTNFTPNVEGTLYTPGLPNPVTLPNMPKLKLVAVGGIVVPATLRAAFTQDPDIVIPTTVTNPVTVNIEANELPVGTVLQVNLFTAGGVRSSVNTTPLTGSQSLSTASASVTLPNFENTMLTVTATLNVLLAYGLPMHINGKKIDKVEIAAAYGGETRVTYLTDQGERVKWPSE